MKLIVCEENVGLEIILSKRKQGNEFSLRNSNLMTEVVIVRHVDRVQPGRPPEPVFKLIR